MRIIKSEKRLCSCCMEEHEVKTVINEKEVSTFKNVKVEYEAEYMYCANTEMYFADERQLDENDIRKKDSYRKINDLLTSEEIKSIRKKYEITQSDLSLLLGWGEKTVTRYESHQVQDRAHDDLLKIVRDDPDYFISCLKKNKGSVAEDSYVKYLGIALSLCEEKNDTYLRKAIMAKYAKFQGNEQCNGAADLSLDKVVDVIRYFASSSKVKYLFKVKLMKLLWYADSLAYKQRGHAITGLVYAALPMGAVPVGHNSIIDLKDVPCEEVVTNDHFRYLFSCYCDTFPCLAEEEIEILEKVIDKFGKMTAKEIVDYMHEEEAYKKTVPKEIIQFKYVDHLHI